MAVLYQVFLFLIGGSGYVGLEFLWRGRSHISMFLAGGVFFLLLGRIDRTKISPSGKCLLGAAAITAVELLTGLLLNRDYRVWDYRALPGNFRGQICPQFCAVWLPVAAGAMGLYGLVEKGMEKMLWGRPAEG